jgi:hypothetical protein
MNREWTPYRDPRAKPPKKCFYCNEPLSEKHVAYSRETGKYQVNWEGDIGCKKCFFTGGKRYEAISWL